MGKLGVSEIDIYDAFKHGDWIILPGETKAVIRKQGGYEIGTTYIKNSNGEYAVIGPWKRKRR